MPARDRNRQMKSYDTNITFLCANLGKATLESETILQAASETEIDALLLQELLTSRINNDWLTIKTCQSVQL